MTMEVYGRSYMERFATSSQMRHLERMVDELERHVPRMLQAHSSRDAFWQWFNGEADSMQRNALTPKHKQQVRERLDGILQKNGLPIITRHSERSA